MTRWNSRPLALLPCVAALLLGGPGIVRSAQYEVTLPADTELLGTTIAGEQLTLVLRSSDDQVTLSRYEAGEVRWSVPLDFVPAGNPSVSGGGSVFVAAYACEACPPGPLRVVSSRGEAWVPEGTVSAVAVAELADRFLVHAAIDGRSLVRAYGGSGRVIGEVELPDEPVRHLDLAAMGDAVLIVEGDVGEPGRALRLYDLSAERWERQVLPHEETVGSATAFDHQTAISWGDWGEGSLRLHRFNDGERSDVLRGWSRSFNDRPYYPVDLAAEAGLILATDGGERYDLLDTSGEVLWSLAPKQEATRLAGWLGISEADARTVASRLRVELAGDGSIILADPRQTRAYLLRWPGDAGYGAEPAVVPFATEGTRLDTSGGYLVKVEGRTVRYGTVDDWQ